jgi:hypothetical protein
MASAAVTCASQWNNFEGAVKVGGELAPARSVLNFAQAKVSVCDARREPAALAVWVSSYIYQVIVGFCSLCPLLRVGVELCQALPWQVRVGLQGRCTLICLFGLGAFRV